MNILNNLNDIPLYSYEASHIYRIYKEMPLMELMKEYKVASIALAMFHENDLESSVVVEYLPGIVQIMQFVISERVSDFLKVEACNKCM